MITFASVFFASLYTAIRIGIAYSIALFWTLSVAILIAKKTSLLKYLMPIFDVGQSIPAVAIFPIIVVFLINSLGNGSVAIEIASILLIMTGVQWYLLFNFIRAIRAIPSEINDLGRMISIDKKSQIKEIILPAITPAIIVGSLEATAGGLNATVISENIVYDNQVYSTLGLGYLMSQGAAVGDTTAIIISVLAMMIMVLLVNRLVWKRMLSAIEKYKFVV
jgi:NitT/TauT family transport system permease protein